MNLLPYHALWFYSLLNSLVKRANGILILCFYEMVSSWLQHGVGPSPLTHLPSRQSILRSFKIALSNRKDLEMDVYMKSGTLSSTLDMLCAWEKKLHEEVKVRHCLIVHFKIEAAVYR